MPLDETLTAFEGPERQGKIRHWGVSNFDVIDMGELLRLTGKVEVALVRRRGIPSMAYSPLEQGRLAACHALGIPVAIAFVGSLARAVPLWQMVRAPYASEQKAKSRFVAVIIFASQMPHRPGGQCGGGGAETM